MIDLETSVLQLISKCCNPNNCLSLYLLVENLESLATISAPAVMTAKEEVRFPNNQCNLVYIDKETER